MVCKSKNYCKTICQKECGETQNINRKAVAVVEKYMNVEAEKSSTRKLMREIQITARRGGT